MTIKETGEVPRKGEDLWEYYARLYPETKTAAEQMKDDILNPKKITGGAKCPKCAEYSLFAEGIQLRSADEGQSELMRCDNCGFLKVIK